MYTKGSVNQACKLYVFKARTKLTGCSEMRFQKLIPCCFFICLAFAGYCQEVTNEGSAEAKLWVIPNPNNGNFTVKSSEPGKFTMVNILGETVQVFDLNANNNNTVSIKETESGLYFITNMGNRVRQRVVVTR
jgi:hypothetical protein